MTDRETAIVEALGEVAPAWIAQIAIVPRRCLLATALGLEVLRYFDVPARPVLAFVGAFNAAWREHVEVARREGRPGLEGEALVATGAHCVVASDHAVGPGISGHVMIRLRDKLLDLDAQQFRREAKAILIPDAILLSYPEGREFGELSEVTATYPLEAGGRLVVQVVPEIAPWLEPRARDWHRVRRGDYKREVGHMIREVRAHVARAERSNTDG